jgi:hypothetical protein
MLALNPALVVILIPFNNPVSTPRCAAGVSS